MEQQEKFEQQSASHEDYMKALRTKFSSLDVAQRQVALGDIEILLSAILRLGNNEVPKRTSNFNRVLAKEIRIRERLNQKQLADRVGLSQATISRYESGERDHSERPIGEKYLSWLREHGYE